MNFDDLASRIEGNVVESGSPAYADLPRTSSSRFDGVQPTAVVQCRTAQDVVQAVEYVRGHRLESATRCGGHCFAGRSSTRGLLIDVSLMNSVSISDGVARIGAGAKLGEVYEALLSRGLTVPAGTCPSVGVSGFTLGGGLGMLGRARGLASDHLVGTEIALADGRLVQCSEREEADLFWALRGAGTGHFGVVTELLFRPVPCPSVATVFSLTWPFSDATDVVSSWVGWTPTAPDEISASLDLRASGNLDEPPSVEVFGTALGTRSDARALLEGLLARTISEPDSHAIRELSYREMQQHWARRAGERLEEPRRPREVRNFEAIKSEYFAAPLPQEAVTAIVGNVIHDRVAGQSREVDFSPWGGAYNRVAPEATAFVHRDSMFWIKHTAAVATNISTEAAVAAHGWATRSWQAVHPWGTGGVFPNFPDPDLEDWGQAYYGENYDRLLAIKARYDPDDVFHFNQSLPIVRSGN